MPAFPERASALINRLHSKGEKTQDRRTWIIGHQTENKGREAERFKGFRRGPNITPPSLESTVVLPAPPALTPVAPVPQRTASVSLETTMGTASSGPADDIMSSSLAELSLSGNTSTVQNEPLLPNGHLKSLPEAVLQVNGNGVDGDWTGTGIVHTATLGGVNPSLLAPLTVAPNIEKVSLNHRNDLQSQK